MVAPAYSMLASQTNPVFLVAAVLLAMLPAVAAVPGSTAGKAARQRGAVQVDAKGRLIGTTIVAPARSRPTASPTVMENAARLVEPPADLQRTIEEVAEKHAVDPLLVNSVISVESAYNAKALSPKGAQGLMQLIPATAQRFGVANPFDVRQNIEGGVKYLKFLQGLYKDDVRLALAAYNAGEGAVAKYNNWVPPYRETQQYVDKVGRRYETAKRKAATKKQKDVLAAPPVVAAAQPAPPSQEIYRPIEQYMDAEGRIFLRTR